MYKRLLSTLRNNEEEEEFHDWNECYVQQEMEENPEEYTCDLCQTTFRKGELELGIHTQSTTHKRLVREFRSKYNKLIGVYKKQIYKSTRHRRLKKLQAFIHIYQFQ